MIVKEAKILGIVIFQDLKWAAHVEYMLQRAYKKIWLLRRMKIIKLDASIMTDYYCKEIRSILEYGAAVWHSGITRKMSDQLERVQKICIRIILSDISCNFSYEVCCTILNLEPLIFRRQDLCIRFIQKASIDPQHLDLFQRKTNSFNTRNNKPYFREFICRNSRFYNSPLCYLTRLLNTNPVKKWILFNTPSTCFTTVSVSSEQWV